MNGKPTPVALKLFGYHAVYITYNHNCVHVHLCIRKLKLWSFGILWHNQRVVQISLSIFFKTFSYECIITKSDKIMTSYSTMHLVTWMIWKKWHLFTFSPVSAEKQVRALTCLSADDTNESLFKYNYLIH